jgi:hypothetical protein
MSTAIVVDNGKKWHIAVWQYLKVTARITKPCQTYHDICNLRGLGQIATL